MTAEQACELARLMEEARPTRPAGVETALLEHDGGRGRLVAVWKDAETLDRSLAEAPGSDDSGGRWQFGLVCDYDDMKHLQSYYSTPEHAAVVEEILPLIAARAVCDFEL